MDVETEKVAFEQEKVAFEQEKVAFEQEKVAFEQEKVAFEQEKVAFGEKKVAFERSLSVIKINAPTKEKVLVLFDNFEYERAFARPDIMQICNLASSSAGKMLRRLKETGLIETATGCGRGKYKFIESKE